MTPLDHELRNALAGRAAGVSPSPDPLAGIERRARGMRRRRTAAAVLGTALAVTVVAVAVPVLTASRRAAGPSQFATTRPSAGAGTSPTAAPVDPAVYGLHANRPWAYRGLPIGSLAGLPQQAAQLWASAHHVSASGVELSPLYGQVYESSQQSELVFAARVTGSAQLSWGVVQGGSGRPVLAADSAVPDGLRLLLAALPGDGVRRLLAVSAPGTTLQAILAGGSTRPVATSVSLIPTLALDGTVRRVRVLGPDGAVLQDSAVPPAPAPPTSAAAPANVLSWPGRGTPADGGPDRALLDAFASAVGRPGQGAAAVYRPLWTARSPAGTGYTLGQAWFPGDRAAVDVSYRIGGARGPEFFLGTPTPAAPAALAWVVTGAGASSTDLLVVVPRPGTGQVSYSPDARSAFRPVASGRSDSQSVGLIDRDPRANADRIQVLSGDGNLDRPLYRGPVLPLLCGSKGCG